MTALNASILDGPRSGRLKRAWIEGQGWKRVGVIMIMAVFLYGSFAYHEPFRDAVAIWIPQPARSAPLFRYGESLDLPPIPLSDSFHALLPLVTSTTKDKAEFDAIRRAYLHSNKTEHCGPWQGQYSQLHADMLANPHGARYVIADGPGGFADKALGWVSSFLYALLTDRVWMASSFYNSGVTNKMPDVRFAFNSRNIDWSRREAPPAESGTLEAFSRPYEWILNTYDSATQAELDALAPEQHVQAVMNRGLAYNWLLNPTSWAGRRLKSLGFTPGNVYGCVLNYLFEPLPQTAEIIANYHGLLGHESVLSITVQTRLGDARMRENAKGKAADLDLKEFSYMFQCAADLARQVARPHHKHFIINSISDYEPLSRQVARDMSFFIPEWNHPTLGPPLGFSTGIVPKHVHDAEDDTHPDALPMIQNEMGVQGVIIDSYTQDATDYLLGFGKSGFARLSALRVDGDQPRFGYVTESTDCTSLGFLRPRVTFIYDMQSA